jgi:hypothetical protein
LSDAKITSVVESIYGPHVFLQQQLLIYNVKAQYTIVGKEFPYYRV